MDIERMRSYISEMYPGPRWKNRVRDMRPNQVIALYKSFKRSGRKPIKVTKQPYEQLSLFR